MSRIDSSSALALEGRSWRRGLARLAPRAAGLLLIAACPLLGSGLDTLRVCADSNNLPFSNERGEGFENRLAELMARDLGAKLQYTWWSQRKSFIRNSLDAGRCDVLMGVPAALDAVAATRPYYRSTYVFVSRKDRGLRPASLADPRLDRWRIGIHVVGDDYAPPSVALARRGLAANVTGFNLFGPAGEENPPAKLIHAVAAGRVDLAIVWGPFAGYFARAEEQPLEIAPVSPPMFLGIPFTFDISMGVRKADEALKARLDDALERNCAAVRSILERYSVPQVPRGEDDKPCGMPRQLPVSSSR